MIDNCRLTIVALQTGGQSINAPDIKISQSHYQRNNADSSLKTYLSHHRLHPSFKISRHHSTSQPTIRSPTMSSSSSTPSSTSTAGSSSGSTGSHLPYAPFPYPLPSGGRGSGQQGK
ncbi:hypothetical protein HBI26_148980 [Parastagonospora nodorum]|nr:hypothetical protein HBH51_131170 [Parastagonospora nodorum]KAH4863429.1 hypothetical protein HBH75_005030 [Parastagonospora nodorum]KAH5572711.1 hypothetical protein HBI26_148980 [Parastagonospora nodorum]KAH6022907.1 hypothetical protein HBI82_076520 [Parastagonospora nodorum]KAH6214194.1 hypothetical protein HBI43_138750 [Parastagonospora nodorum]